MHLLEIIETTYKGQKKKIELYKGDLTDLVRNEHFDVLVISAFPNDYLPTPGSLVGALDRRNLSVASLAMVKELDMRTTHACWLSGPIEHTQYRGIEFDHILCFEPLIKNLSPVEMIRDLFQALTLITDQYGLKTLVLPLINTGDAQLPVELILDPLIEAAINWMKLGLGLDAIKIVAYSNENAAKALERFKALKEQYAGYQLNKTDAFTYDYFISYSHKDSLKARLLLEHIMACKKDARIFFDKKDLQAGHAWQTAIFEAMDKCAKVITIWSADYLQSSVCKEEYAIALYRQRESQGQVLVPIYLYTCELPTYMRLTQYIDCREGVDAMIQHAVAEICANSVK